MATISGNGITIDIDVILSESVKRSGKVTSSPVEGKKTISDHFVKNQSTVSISGICTTDAANKLANLKKIFNGGILCSYTGSRNILKNVIITSFNSDHAGDAHKAFTFDVTFTTVQISTTEEFSYNTKAPASKSAAQTKKTTNTGTKQTATKTVDTNTQAKAKTKATSAVSSVRRGNVILSVN